MYLGNIFLDKSFIIVLVIFVEKLFFSFCFGYSMREREEGGRERENIRKIFWYFLLGYRYVLIEINSRFFLIGLFDNVIFIC